MKRQHADEMHRPDAGAHGKRAAQQPERRMPAPCRADASREIEGRVRSDDRHRQGKRDELVVVHGRHWRLRSRMARISADDSGISLPSFGFSSKAGVFAAGRQVIHSSNSGLQAWPDASRWRWRWRASLVILVGAGAGLSWRAEASADTIRAGM